MNLRLPLCLVALAGIVFFASALARGADEPRRPNVVLILADNHGPWTLGCYGNREILTPNIDRLASEGTLFTRCYSSNAACSPTRATLLTGLIPSQHGVHCYLGAGEPRTAPHPEEDDRRIWRSLARGGARRQDIAQAESAKGE